MLCIIGPIIGALAGGVLAEGISASLAPSLATARNRPGDFLRVAQEIQRLRARGLDARVSSDPFTGNILISTADQEPILEQLAFEAAVRAATQPSQAFSEALFRARERFIESRRVFPVFPTSPGPPPAIVAAAQRVLPSVVRRPPLGGRIRTFARRSPVGPLAVLR